MNYLLDTERVEREHTERLVRRERMGEYASGYCACCGSDVGLDEDEEPCGHCQAGKDLLEEEEE